MVELPKGNSTIFILEGRLDMRRIFIFLLALTLVASCAIGVSAASAASHIGAYATVSSDGSCQVAITATIRLEEAVEKLYFPVPEDARNVTLNGSRVSTTRQDNARLVNLSGITGKMTGEFTIHIQYSLSDTVYRDEDDLLRLRVPLLAGFTYPIEAMEFSVTLPGEIENRPSFSSGYHKTSIEKDLTYTISGATVSGAFQKSLKDRETFEMNMLVSENMFPQPIVEVNSSDFGQIAVLVCMGVALLYWLLFMAVPPIFRRYRPDPPDGYSAGEMGCLLALQGVDLSLMVLTWSELGYVMIQDGRRVMIHKVMEMGNERSETEQHYFHKLFSRQNTVDTTSRFYAELVARAKTKPSRIQDFVNAKTGNPLVFRGLVSGIGLFGGILIASAMTDGAFLQWLLIISLGLAGGISGWMIQDWSAILFLRKHPYTYYFAGVCGLWLLLGLISGAFAWSVAIVVMLLIGGFLYTYGGKRTAMGRQAMGQVLGLRRYFRSVHKPDLQRICEGNPDYFHAMLPYAIAVGAGHSFAKHFGKDRQPDCPYLSSNEKTPLTALEWYQRIDAILTKMDARANQLKKEKLFKAIAQLRR